MELTLAVAACIVAIVSMVIVFKLATDLGEIRQTAAAADQASADARAEAGKASQDTEQARLADEANAQAVAVLREELAQLRSEMNQLRTSLESPPPPPLPRARTGNLEDLREQLRAEQAAHPGDDDDA